MATQTASLISADVIKNVVFFGEKINKWIVAQLNKVIPLTDTQNNILLYTVYLIMLLVVIKSAERIKTPIKIIIVGLLVFLVIGFFKPI